MRVVQAVAGAIVSIVLVGLIGWPGETITSMAGHPEPWNPPGRGTPPIDVLNKADKYGEIFGDVQVMRRGYGVAAVRLADGIDSWVYQHRWDHELGPHIRVDERYYAVAWRDGRVTLIDVPAARIAWRAHMSDGPLPRAHQASDEEGVTPWGLSVARHGSTPVLVVLHDGRIDALDSRTGAIRWSYQSPSCGPISKARGEGGAVLVVHRRGDREVGDRDVNVALSPDDGRLLWTFSDGALYESRAIGADRLALADIDGLVVRRAVDGKILWRAPLTRPANDSFSDAFGVAGDLLTVRTETEVVAHRVADGRIAWRHPVSGSGAWLDSVDGTSRAPPTVVDTVLTDGVHTYAAEDARTLVKFDARTGRVIDRRRFDEELYLEDMQDGLAVISVGDSSMMID
ncbi:outer membrane protein assembly factor BamB family protein [Nonomuraea sp. SYSU D8015]|uniref:outer membrane protein assembly factor BamB family protein n=1 Tax=Nonomuraea sp. SYSU D8015 TaxID=2593644 RepID=UPI0016614D33|nr:PQQ-binding-like beta-propeller repeat protein [Nonomuraea sp. SYSU D8015]